MFVCVCVCVCVYLCVYACPFDHLIGELHENGLRSQPFLLSCRTLKRRPNDIFGDVVAHAIDLLLGIIDSNTDHLDRLNLIIL